MAGIRRVLLVIAWAVQMTGAGFAAPDLLNGSADERLKALARIQPGLGTVMMEYSYRFSTAYFAAKAGNWPLANYEIKEMREAQEVGETTRPQKAQALKAFEHSFLDPLSLAVGAKDFGRFESSFNAGIRGCNACHRQQGVPFIRYGLPSSPPGPLVMEP